MKLIKEDDMEKRGRENLCNSVTMRLWGELLFHSVASLQLSFHNYEA